MFSWIIAGVASRLDEYWDTDKVVNNCVYAQLEKTARADSKMDVFKG